MIGSSCGIIAEKTDEQIEHESKVNVLNINVNEVMHTSLDDDALDHTINITVAIITIDKTKIENVIAEKVDGVFEERFQAQDNIIEETFVVILSL